MAKNPRYRAADVESFGLTIQFDTDKLRRMFIGWLTDGGGEQEFSQVLEAENMGFASTEPAFGQKTWPWGSNMEAGEPNYTIAMKVEK